MRRFVAPVLALAVLALMVAPPAPVQAFDVHGTFVDDDGNTHEPYIEAIAAAGITTGCGADRYCPGDTVTRAQMASFLARTLGLDPVQAGSFTDIGGSVHAGNINAIAVEGITLGCTATEYCPNDRVRRDQMASFLARALGLDPVSTGPFTDIDRTVHAGNINALYAAGITKGCSPTEYCPSLPLPRDQMATLLGRARGLDPVYARIPLVDTSVFRCSKDGRSCSGSATVPRRGVYRIEEGWFQVLPYRPGEEAAFIASNTRFDLTVNGAGHTLSPLPLVSSASTATRDFRALIYALPVGRHTLVGRWTWRGTTVRTTTLFLTVEG
jgi:hypothetical protein